MGRTAQALKNNTKVIAIALLIVTGGGLATWQYQANSGNVQTVTNSQKQVTQISYEGKDNVDALTLLKDYATVETKTYDFGDMVVSINGTKATGTKYWSFYVNDKMAEVGASTYKTKDGETITWKLQ